MSIYRQEPHYTSKPSLWRRLGKLLLLLLLLAGIASAVFLLFFRGYVVETPDGPRLQLPFLAKSESQTSKHEEDSAVFSKDSTVTLPDEESTPLLSPLHAIRLDQDAILESSAEKQMQEADCNAVLLDMRKDDGSLCYVSKLSIAIDSGASAATPGLNEAILEMNRNPDVYSIARVSCFSDDYLSKSKPDLALQRVSGVPWRDQDQRAWLFPDRDEVQSYLSDICRELSALGFDEILLTHCYYPTQGARAQQFEGSESVEALALSMEGFYQELRRVLAAEQVTLSIQYEESPKSETGAPLNGQRLDALLPLADRVWLDQGNKAATEVFFSHGLSSSDISCVSILEKSGNISDSWAIN